MAPDFTYEMYGELIDAGLAAGLPFITVREYCTAETLPDAFVLLRHDVDRKPENALDFARIEADRGVQSTYYVRTVPATFDPDIVRELAALGHEVGYHYEDMDRANGDVEAAHESFATHLAKVRELVDVDTVCMHGNPLTSHDNRDMWGESPELERYGLVGEAYLSMDFTDVHYYSDTGRTWRDGALKVKDHPVGAARQPVPVSSTPELVDLVGRQPDARYCLLTHPDRWAGSEPERMFELLFDTTKNSAKYALHLVSNRGVTPQQ